MEYPKLWEKYPKIWPTKAKFFAWLRGGLRRGLWEKMPVKFQFKNSQCLPPPEDYTGRARSGTYCALSGEWTGKSALEVDHIEGNVPLNDWEDVLPFILHMCATEEQLQLVSKSAHKDKSYAERMCVTYKEAVRERKAIALMKENSGKDWLTEQGIEPASNAKLRREQIVEELKCKE